MTPKDAIVVDSEGDDGDTFAAGWNAACEGKPLERGRSADWKTGWRGAMALDPSERTSSRFNAI
jgi:hypothetical protein